MGAEPVRRRDGHRYLVVGFSSGTEYDLVTLDPNAAESNVTHDVDW